MSDHLESQPPAPEPVPFPPGATQRMVGSLPEPNGHPRRQSHATPAPAAESLPPQPVAFDSSTEEAVQAVHSLKMLELGVHCGLLETAGFFAEIIGTYQQRFLEHTGQRMPFPVAVDQVFQVMSLIPPTQ